MFTVFCNRNFPITHIKTYFSDTPVLQKPADTYYNLLLSHAGSQMYCVLKNAAANSFARAGLLRS